MRPSEAQARFPDAAPDLHQQAAREAAAARAARYMPDDLTLRILSALARGASRHETAEALRISESTVRRKLAQVRAGWSVESNTEVVVTAVRIGLI